MVGNGFRFGDVARSCPNVSAISFTNSLQYPCKKKRIQYLLVLECGWHGQLVVGLKFVILPLLLTEKSNEKCAGLWDKKPLIEAQNFQQPNLYSNFPY